jgi:uncharacterized protein YbjQ (UPF0145 family)
LASRSRIDVLDIASAGVLTGPERRKVTTPVGLRFRAKQNQSAESYIGKGGLLDVDDHHTVVEGKPVSRYLGVVTGEAIIGANVFRDLLASVRDVVGGRSATYEKGLAEARTVAMKEMEQRASELGANAVIGIDLDYEVLGQNNGMLMVSVSGTAVVC